MSAVVRPANDLAECDREPIHIPGSIQGHGTLLVLDPVTLEVRQAAVGCPDALAAGATDPVGRRFPDLLAPAEQARFADVTARAPEGVVAHLGTLERPPHVYHVLAHRHAGRLIVELEQADETHPRSFDEVYPGLADFLTGLQGRTDHDEISRHAAAEVRRITGLDRVLVYRFDDEWNGTVIAEDGNGRLPSYLGLRFPASDIPAQARELYRLNRLRLIADAGYRPVPIRPSADPAGGGPVDLSHAVLRSVSPIHLEYMRNMGTAASMSISLLREGRLWGLISCHAGEPARVSHPVRTACDFIGQILSMQLGAIDASALAARRSSLRAVHHRLFARATAAEGFVAGLAEGASDLLDLAGANGAAVVSGPEFALVGATPGETEVRTIVRWLAEAKVGDVFATDRLPALIPQGDRLADTASGLLAMSVSSLHDSFVLWFRPEVVSEVIWGGDPRKRIEEGPADARIHPRRSFENWLEIVRGRSSPWDRAHLEAVAEFRTAVVDIVLRKAEELASLNEQLVRSNRELEAFSYSVSHDLRAPFRHIVGYAQLLKRFEGETLSERANRYIDTIIDSALAAGTLVDDLLSFSQMGRATLTPVRIDMDQLLREVLEGLVPVGGGSAQLRIASLEPAEGDPVMLRLVFQNLVENALKFSAERDPPVIEIWSETAPGEVIYHVRDNGAGFDMAYIGKLFGVFQRLHRAEDYEGTGIGLANVKRIVERHGGRVWAEGRVGGGATFSFSLPAGGGDDDV